MINVTSPATITQVVLTSDNKHLRSYSRHRDYVLNGLALTYIICGYSLSLVGISSRFWWENTIAFFLLIHTLTLAAFFLHEFMHYNIFSSRRWNVAFGEVMLFLTGTCYSRFCDLAPHHIAHHVHRADFSPFYPFSLSDFLRSLPRPVLQLITVLEWLCIPAVALIFRWMIAIAPFLSQHRKDERRRNGVLLLIRGGLFTGLALYSPRAVVLYFLAYICLLHILQFTEGFQHTYSTYRMHGDVPKYTLAEDEANTYSLRLPAGLAWLGPVLFLNNNHHNAHHRLMSCPWYLLPQLSTELYGEHQQPTLPFFKLLHNYFRYRVHRLFHGQGTVERSGAQMNCDHFLGASGMSFMLLRQPFDWLDTSAWLESGGNLG